MSLQNQNQRDELRPEYYLAQLKGVIRAKYLDRYQSSSEPTLFTPDVIRAFVWLLIGMPAIFAAHVLLPFLYVKAAHARTLPDWINWSTEIVDPVVLLPFLLAFVGYNFVLHHCTAILTLFKHHLIRWPMAFVAAFFSHWVEMIWILNTFGS